MQEDWGVFRDLPRHARRFTELTGVEVEVTLTVIPEMWTLMEQAFSGEEPLFDLVGVDDLHLIAAARAGHVVPLDDLVARDGYPLDDFRGPVLDALSDGGRLWGLPYCDVSNVLVYRADLFERHGIPVPQTFPELTGAALAVQEAVRAGGRTDFHGVALRGAPNCGLNFWLVGSTWGPSFGVRWYGEDGRPTIDTPELHEAVAHYVDLLRRCGPPESPSMDFMDCMRVYAEGRAALTIEPANEASLLYDAGGPVAEATRTARVPAGPAGTRHPGLYTPPYAIPARSPAKEAAWELGKFLCAPEQVLADARSAGFVEVARESVLAQPAFAERFRPELLETVRATRPDARGERPVTRFGMEVGNVIADQVHRALVGRATVAEALREAQRGVEALGSPA
jgi:sorbitol/mannitol transport system substrate-binding protein